MSKSRPRGPSIRFPSRGRQASLSFRDLVFRTCIIKPKHTDITSRKLQTVGPQWNRDMVGIQS